MTISRSWMMFVAALLLVPSCTRSVAQSQKAETSRFQEIYGLVRSNLNTVTEAELDAAAVRGLLDELGSMVLLVTNRPPADATAGSQLISRTNLFDGAYSYLRIQEVDSGLSKELAERLNDSKKLKGAVLDLRFAYGQNYQAAAEAADQFMTSEQALLKQGETTISSTAKNSAINLPLVVLVNRETTGAAEALVAILRQANLALVIGAPTAGHAYAFKEVSLQNGNRLRIATGSVRLGNGQELSKNGFNPDIRIEIGKEEEKAYFADPYKVMAKPFAQSVRPGTNDLSSLFGTNRFSRRRINEAELLRMQREGVDLNAESEPPAALGRPLVPVVHDPALARGLDFLKGFALVQGRR
jgi:hypothetical protein